MEEIKNSAQGEEQVALSNLASVVGFPEDHLKSDVVADQKEISLTELRRKVIGYLMSLDWE